MDMYKKHNILDVFVELELRDKEGKLLKKRRFKSKTWVRNFIAILNRQMGGDANIQQTDGSWTDRSRISANPGQNDDRYGIQVGTGSNPWAYDQYKLQSQIYHGTDAGKMMYGACSVSSLVSITNGLKYVVSRVFTNGTSDTITVREIGLVVGYPDYPEYSVKLAARDVLSPAVDVPAGSSLTVRYVIQWSWA
jgi:hypothetical protein